MKVRVLLAFGLVLLLFGSALAQAVTKVRKGSADYLAIVRVAKAEFQKSAAFPIKTPAGLVRRCGNYAYVSDVLAFVDPKHVGDGQGMALLKLKGKKWVIVDSTVGSGGMEDLAADWAKQYKLPKALFRG